MYTAVNGALTCSRVCSAQQSCGEPRGARRVQDNATEVTAAGIARLAGVGRAAVSNWRRRHADFPKPVGGTETSPSFALTDVEHWLREQGKLAEVPLRERVWQQLAGPPRGPRRRPACTPAALCCSCTTGPPTGSNCAAGSDERARRSACPAALTSRSPRRFGPRASAPCDLPAHRPRCTSVPLLRGAAELAAELGARQTYEFLLGRHLDANPRQYTLTPAGPAELMADLAGPARTVARPRPAAPAPCCAPCATRTRPARSTARTARPRARRPHRAAARAARRPPTAHRAHRGRRHPARRRLPRLRADAVLCHPPFNERNWGHDELAYDAALGVRLPGPHRVRTGLGPARPGPSARTAAPPSC